MERRDCDAIVLFGATGDLCYRKILPALYNLVRRGILRVPVTGVARAGWKLEQMQAHVRESIETFVPKAEAAVLDRFLGLIRYVDGDYNDRTTFEALRRTLDNAERPLHYLAIPPSMFPVVIEHLAATMSAPGTRIVVEKPFGRELAQPCAAQALSRVEHFPHRSLSRQGSGAEHSFLPLRQLLPRAGVESQLRHERADHHGGDPRGGG